MSLLPTFLLILNIFSTLFMTGLIWFVQIVHYPLFSEVGKEGFIPYQEKHQWRTTWVVGPPMLIEAFTAVLLIRYPPIPNTSLLLMGVGLVFLIWASTAFLQIPCHGELTRGYQAKYQRRLVLTNWIRTVAWTLRSILLGWVAFSVWKLAAAH
ncbi:MAG: hypothetical protein MK106_03115 [Mariniblastus sp.]|nr:hypothetical protein [Mariniblastus sp.]